MKRSARLPLIAALVAMALLSVPIASHALKPHTAVPGARPAGIENPSQEGWGAAARSGCRYGIMNGGLVPGSALSLFTGGVCLLAFLDVLL